MNELNRLPPAMFIADNLALDFLNSIATPKSVEIDWMDSWPHLSNWLVQSGLCLDEELAQLAEGASEADLSGVLLEIHELREEFRSFIHATFETGGVNPDDPMIEKINGILQSGSLSLQLEKGQDAGFNLASRYVLRKPADLLPRFAEACAKLICEADFQYVRNCEGPTCTMLFLDVSKNHKRRWCSMSVCGNRAKAAAHRKAKTSQSLN